MSARREDIWKDGEYSYEAAYGFVPNLRFYLHDKEDAGQGRTFMLVVPGGGYCMVVPPEAESVAKEFYERGMNCAVLTYTTDITMSVPLGKQPLQDISRAVRYIRRNAARLGAEGAKLVICGFSAGAHVCGTLAVHYSDVADPDPELAGISNRPDAVILSYPVITSGEFTHIYSMWALIGKDGPKDEYEYFSLEKHLTPDTPPVFLWQTVEDDLVPVENSMMFAEACRKAGVPYAYYAFPHGPHGLSIHTDAWRRGEFGEPYTMEQVMRAVEAVREGRGVRVSDARRAELIEQFDAFAPAAENRALGSDDGTAAPQGEAPDKEGEDSTPDNQAPKYEDVALWPDLAEAWLRKIL